MTGVRPISDIDILMWADYTWCYREDLADMNHMSDDYRVIPMGTQEWEQLVD